MEFFPNFSDQMVKTSEAVIRTRVHGEGPPLLLLHGHPQTHVAWHKIAESLAGKFTVVLTDLRGYGDSSKLEGGPRHINYSKRAMARDQLEVMRQLGYERFFVAGHDRGARVAHRLALDHPSAVRAVAMLDIVSTAATYARTDKEFATRYFWWFFQIQPEPLPEKIAGADLAFYVGEHLRVQCKTPGAITEEAMAEYLRCYDIHCSCEDYRAAADIDLEHDAEDRRKGNKITAPLLALWGAKGAVGQLFDVLALWREEATEVNGRALDCGHLLPEERPAETSSELIKFFGKI
jgi:haloacetate dehalogenase